MLSLESYRIWHDLGQFQGLVREYRGLLSIGGIVSAAVGLHRLGVLGFSINRNLSVAEWVRGLREV